MRSWPRVSSESCSVKDYYRLLQASGLNKVDKVALKMLHGLSPERPYPSLETKTRELKQGKFFRTSPVLRLSLLLILVYCISSLFSFLILL